MIYGTGTDIVAVARMGKLYARHGEHALEKLLAAEERADFTKAKDAARFLAKRFAAKEAFGKALGIGVATPATLPNIAVIHDSLGKPGFSYSAELAQYLAERGLVAHLSISDEQEFALAFVVMERITP
ncbi:MAG: holo-ACP synthase [Betaproteobacteria bacterium]